MKFELISKNQINLNTFFRRCGYKPIRDRRTNQDSYVRRLGSDHYPRFHLYINNIENNIIFSTLHIDQKKIILNKKMIHAGDYEDDSVKREAGRITQLLINYNV